MKLNSKSAPCQYAYLWANGAILGSYICLRHDQQPALLLLHTTAFPKHSLVYEKHHVEVHDH